MEVKILGRNVVPDKITLYENDCGSKSLVFSVAKINDGVNLTNLYGFLEVEKSGGFTDKFVLQKTITNDLIYFTLDVNTALTETAEILNAQISFENDSKSITYKTAVFLIDVKYSVDGLDGYEQVLPSLVYELEESVKTLASEVKSSSLDVSEKKTEIDEMYENITQINQELTSKVDAEFLPYIMDVNENSVERDNELESEINKIKENLVIVDDTLSLDSVNAVQNKVVANKINEVEQTAITAKGIADDVLVRTLNLEGSKLNKSDVATINGQDITSGGNIEIVGGSGGNVTIDSELSTDSENAVQNKVVTEALDGKLDKKTSTSTARRVYIVTQNGEQSLVNLQSGETSAYAIVMREGGGTILLPNISTITNEANKQKSAVRYDYVHSLINSVKSYTHIVTITNESGTIDIRLTILSYSNALFTSINASSNFNNGKNFLIDCSWDDFLKIVTISAQGTGYDYGIAKPDYRIVEIEGGSALAIATDTELNQTDTNLTVTDTIV